MSVKIKVLKNHVAIQEIKEPEKSKGGIYIPTSEKSASMKGSVVAVGPGLYDKKGNRKKPNFTEGDIVIYSKGSGQHLEVDRDTKLLVLKPEDILAKIVS